MKKEPQRKFSIFKDALVSIVVIALLAGTFFLAAANLAIDSETNRLLSSFQRTDTVKEECDDGFIPLDGKCYATIGTAKDFIQWREWKRLCEDGPVGPQCDINRCRDEGEGIE